MMSETSGTTTMWGGFLLFFLIFALIFRGGFGIGANPNAMLEGGCRGISNCEVERRGIIDSATTNYNILQQGDLTRETILKDGMATREKIDFYAYDNLKTALADEKAKNIALENKFYSSEKFNELNQANNVRFYALERALDKKPNAYPCYSPTASPCGQTFPSGCCAG